MTSIGFVTVASAVSDIQKRFARETYDHVKKTLSDYSDLLKFYPIVTSYKDAEKLGREISNEIDYLIVFVWSGGTDRMILNVVSNSRKPALIYAMPTHNSLASVREAIAALRYMGMDVAVEYGTLSEVKNKLEPFIKAVKASKMLKESRFGHVGDHEHWILIRRDEKILKERLGLELVRVPWEEMLNIAKSISKDSVADIVSKLKSEFGRVNRSDEDLDKAVRLYLAMKEIAKKYSLHSLAVEARDMLDEDLRDWGPYLGVALMSDDGYPSDYEGEHDAVITKLIIYYLTGKVSFMANLTQINREDNTVIFSHCTVPTKMIDKSKSEILSYYETDRTVAIRGKLKDGEKVTFARIGGKDLDKMMFGTGTIVNGMIGRDDLCRTQILVKVDGDAMELLNKSLGNHIVVVYGDITRYLEYFCRINNIEAIKI